MAQGQLAAWHQRQLSARFAAVRVKVADGPPQRIHDMGAQHLAGEEVWLVGEHRSTGERKYYLTISRPTLRSSSLPELSRPAGSANRRISNSRKNSASITSRADHGRVCTGTR